MKTILEQIIHYLIKIRYLQTPSVIARPQSGEAILPKEIATSSDSHRSPRNDVKKIYISYN